MIQWASLEGKLRDFLQNGAKDKNRTLEQTSLQIETYYIEEVLRSAQEQFGNVLLTLNKFTLAASLSRGFRESLRVNVGFPIALNAAGMFGLPPLWAGAQFSLDIPPPGSIRIVSNTVVNPGIFPTLSVGGPDTLVRELINGFQAHARTISGITIALVVVGTSLVPTPFLWQGVS